MAGDEYHRGVGEMIYTSFFSSVDYTTRYQGELVRDIVKKRGYRTIGFVVPGTMPHGLMSAVLDGFEGLTVIDITPQIDRLIALKSEEELELLRRCAIMQDAIFDKVIKTIKPGMRDVDVTAMAYAEGWVRGSSQGIYLGGSAPLGKPSFLVGRHFQDRTLQKGDNLSFLVEVNGPGGYFTEVGRTIVLGKASQQLLDNFAHGEGGAGLFGQPAQARHPMPRACQGARRFHGEARAAQGAAALRPRPGLRHGGAAAGARRRADVDRERACASRCIRTTRSTNLFMIVCDNYIVGANGSERIHKTERKVFEVY